MEENIKKKIGVTFGIWRDKVSWKILNIVDYIDVTWRIR